MINPYHSLRHGLAERSAPAAGSAFGDARHLKPWLDALPRANHQVYSRELMRALTTLRGQRHEGFERLELLELLRPALLETTALLSNRLQGSTFPLSGVKAQTAVDLMAMQRELALAYRIAVVEACAPSGKPPVMCGKQVTLLLVRAMYHHVRWLASSYFLYRRPERGIWAQLYALAAFGSSLGLDGKTIEDEIEKTALSVVLLQNQAVLMSLANPYRFSQREMPDLWALARDAAGLMALTPQRFAATGVVVCIDQDRQPGYVTRAPAPSEGEVLWVDSRSLVASMRSMLERAGTAAEVTLKLSRSRRPTLPTHFVERVLEGWGQDVARAFPRLDGGYVLESVIGLGSLHYQLAGRRDVETFVRQLSGLKVSPVAVNDRTIWAKSGSDAMRADPKPVQVLDQSLGGYRLRWDALAGARARVGELVGLALPRADGGHDWMAGVVRWLRYEDEGVETGVDLIARRVQAVGLQALDMKASQRLPVRALALVPVSEALQAEGGELFLLPDLGGLEGSRLQVIRAARRWQFENGESARVYECTDLQVLESLGNYLVLRAVPLAGDEVPLVAATSQEPLRRMG